MAAWVDNLTGETPRELSASLTEAWLPKRWTFGMRSWDTLPLVDEKEVDDPCWFKIRKEAKASVEKPYSYHIFRRIQHRLLTKSKLLKHNSLESALADRLASKLTKFGYNRWSESSDHVNYVNLREVILSTFTEDPEIRRTIREDLRAATECNPHGKKCYLRSFLNSRRFLACQAYRVANKLWSSGYKSMALKIQNMASKAFDVDIHPGAKIGNGIVIHDYSTAVVIGETSVIGDNVTILQLGEKIYFFERNSPDWKCYNEISGLADLLTSKFGDCRFNTFVYKMDEIFLRKVILKTLIEDHGHKIWKAFRDDLTAGNSLFWVRHLACQAHRVFEKLWSLRDKSLALKIQNMASTPQEVDIRPGANIGSGILIDDATGVVIGKRAVIGDNVTILDQNFYFCRGNSLSGEINYESLNALTDEQSVFIPYDKSKFVTCSGKSFHGIGVTGGFHHKFNNLSPGNAYGGESYEDGGGQFHAIQVHDGDHDSPQSIQPAPSALKNTSFASDQNEKQPPPDNFPSYIKIGAEIVQEESVFNLSGLAKRFLLISANLCLAASAVGLVAGKFLPETARILLSSAGLCSLAGFVLCSVGYVLHSSRRAKLGGRLMTAGGVVAATFAFVLIMGSLAIVMNPFRILDVNFSV